MDNPEVEMTLRFAGLDQLDKASRGVEEALRILDQAILDLGWKELENDCE